MKKYRVNDVFYSLQGEGRNTGRAAVFVRFAGCNLRCSFCDTEFSSFEEMTGEEIVARIAAFPARFVVLTGGEPTLQVDEDFVDQLHAAGFEVAIETNGTRPVARNIDWVTVSPKVKPSETAEDIWQGPRQPDEIKVIFDGKTDPTSLLKNAELSTLNSEPLFYLQPCDTGDAEQNKAITEACVEYIKAHPQWRLSLQTHKLVGFP